MPFKTLPWILALGLAVALGWQWRDSPQVQGILKVAQRAPNPLEKDPATSSATTAPAAAAAATPAVLRKCLLGGRVLYTNEACPAGSAEQPIGGGSVTVFSAPPAGVAAAPADGVAATPNAREPLPSSGEPSLRDKRMDQIIGR